MVLPHRQKAVGYMEVVMKNEKLHSFLMKLDQCIERTESIFSMICMAGVVLAVLAGVAMRFIFRIPNLYGEEISRYLLIASVFIGISLAQRERAHLGIDTLAEALPARAARRLRLFCDILSLIIYVFLAYKAFAFMQMTMKYGQKSPSMTFLPMWIVYSLMFIGFVLTTITTVLLIMNDYFCEEKFIRIGDEDNKKGKED